MKVSFAPLVASPVDSISLSGDPKGLVGSIGTIVTRKILIGFVKPIFLVDDDRISHNTDFSKGLRTEPLITMDSCKVSTLSVLRVISMIIRFLRHFHYL